MKYVFAVLLTFFCIPCWSQTKGDTKIIVAASDSVNLFNRVGLFLVNRGYAIDYKDVDLGSINTSPRKLDKWKPEMKVNVVVSGSKITLSGFGDVSGALTTNGFKSSGTFDPITFTGKNTFMRDCWDELSAIGKEFGKLSFAK